MASGATSLFVSQSKTIRHTVTVGLLTILALHTVLLIDRNATHRSNIALWQDTVNKAPGKTRAWQNLSHHYLMELNFDKAFESIQGLMQSNPSPKFMSQAQSKMGIIYSRRGNMPAAVSAYKEAIRLDPSFPVNHLNLGGVYMRMGNFLKAKEVYDKAEQLYKNHPSQNKIPARLYLNKAYVFYYLKKFEQAETAARTYLDLEPGSKSGLSIFKNIHAAMGKNKT